MSLVKLCFVMPKFRQFSNILYVDFIPIILELNIAGRFNCEVDKNTGYLIPNQSLEGWMMCRRWLNVSWEQRNSRESRSSRMLPQLRTTPNSNWGRRRLFVPKTKTVPVKNKIKQSRLKKHFSHMLSREVDTLWSFAKCLSPLWQWLSSIVHHSCSVNPRW